MKTTSYLRCVWTYHLVRVLKWGTIHYVFRTALTMAHQQGPQAAWYNDQSVHEPGQSVSAVYTPSIEHRVGNAWGGSGAGRR